MATAADVGAWMQAELEQAGQLTEPAAVAGIRARFGAEFVVGHRIGPDVLAAFRALTAGAVVWSQADGAWRRPSRDDPPGKRWLGRLPYVAPGVLGPAPALRPRGGRYGTQGD